MSTHTPFVRAYLRASTSEQDANRARQRLVDFAEANKQRIAAFYVENESGAKLDRPELFRLLNDSQPGDVILAEQIDRLSRLNEDDWQRLRAIIGGKGLHIVALDLPTSYQFLGSSETDDFTRRMQLAMNGMLLDMLAAIARKDYEDRRRRQREGIDKASKLGIYKGRAVDQALHARIKACLDAKMPIRKTATVCGCAKSTVQRVQQSLERGDLAAAG